MTGLLAALKYLCLWENIGWYLTDRYVRAFAKNNQW